MTVVVSTRPPPVPVTVIAWAPSGTVLLIVIVIVDVPEPGAGMGLGLKVSILEPPDKVIAESKPPATFAVMVEVPELPLATVMALGDAVIAKIAVVAVSLTVVVCVMPPPLPVTVSVYVPFAVVVSTSRVKVEVPEPGAAIDVGLKLAVTPVGWPVTVKATAESKPPEMAVVILDVPLLPFATETVVGEAEMVKLGDAVPASASIRALPFGLPQPVDKS